MKLIECLKFWWFCRTDSSNLAEHAKRELERLCDGEDDMQNAMNEHLLKMVKLFAFEGHSGFSASYANSCLGELLDYKPLTPLTGDDDEWNEVSMGGPPFWQNKRCSHVFKNEDGTAYDSTGVIFEDPFGLRYTSNGSAVNIVFPYVPTKRIVKVDENGKELSNA